MAGSTKPQFLPALLLLAAAAALVVASSYAARVPKATAGGGGGGEGADKSRKSDPKCIEATRCLLPLCTNYCFEIGLNTTGFCTFHDLNFYCCCPVPLEHGAATAELPASPSSLSDPPAGLV